MTDEFKKLDILITGVGGQGVILASDVIGDTAVAAGYDVKKTDTLGMAQRGGSVISHMRIARHVYSPLIREGEVDVLMAFEKLEAARWSYYLKSQGVCLINNQSIPPLSISRGNEKYPTDEEISAILKQRTEKIYMIDGVARATELGNVKTLNIFMLGCISTFAPFPIEIWKENITKRLPQKLHEINLKAFELGRKEIQDGHLR